MGYSTQVFCKQVNIRNFKNRKWFNLDNPNLQCKLKNSPQIIGYVIENNDINITEYYDSFFEAFFLASQE